MTNLTYRAVTGLGSLIAAVTMLTAAVPASASVPADTDQVIVSIANLDVASPEGRRVAEHRIRLASSRVCARATNPIEQARCESEAQHNAMTEFNRYAALQPQHDLGTVAR